MRLAFTIGSYAMPQFVELQILSIRRFFGPDCPILVSDDKSEETPRVQALAAKYGASFYTSKIRRHHFAGDMQAVINAIAFAKSTGSDIAVKVSQRLVLVSSRLNGLIYSHFQDPKCLILLPGRPAAHKLRSKGFSKYPFLTDVLMFRAAEIDPDFLRTHYESRWKNGKHYFDGFVEFAINHLLTTDWAGRFHVFNELTEHDRSTERIYLRRYQNVPGEFERYARKLGITHSNWQTEEWRVLERGSYSPQPKA